MRFDVRGRAQKTNRQVRIGSVTIRGNKPRIIIHVKTGSSFWRKRWEQLRRHLGLNDRNTFEVERRGEDANGHAWITVYDACVPPAAKELLRTHPCVDEWHDCMSVSVPHAFAHSWCPGSGPEKVRSRPPMVAKEPRSRACPDEIQRFQEERDGILPDHVTVEYGAYDPGDYVI